jgi:hypothetical protein
MDTVEPLCVVKVGVINKEKEKKTEKRKKKKEKTKK